ncbi:MAG: DUF4293 domain-containing protein [Cytophagales bacterium]|nr:DUF4293 domain-containing protein [Bernardetiaceae bacterium]MDW8204914.1 DUF4293 domain-containing protein [Cytophagales bacterium]
MIQRIQTVFLFLVMLAMTLMLFLPLWNKQDGNTGAQASLTIAALLHQTNGKVVYQQNVIYLGIGAALAIVLAGISLFSYKNRQMQVMLNLINTLVLVGVLIGEVVLSFKGEKFFLPESKGVYGVGFYMPGVALLCNALANRFIRRDEMLVRSMDRLR